MDKLPLPPDFKDFLQLLNSAKVEHLLVGGYAVGVHHLYNLDAERGSFTQLMKDCPNAESHWAQCQANLGRKLYKGPGSEERVASRGLTRKACRPHEPTSKTLHCFRWWNIAATQD